MTAVLVASVAIAGCGDGGAKDGSPVVWAKRAGGVGWDGARATAVDETGAIYVAGFFEQQALFGEGEPGQTQLQVAGDAGGENRDAFLARLTPEGELTWAVAAGGPGADGAHSLAVAADGSVTVVGVFAGEAVFDAGGPGETTLVADAGSTFLARYDGSGALLWARATAGSWSAEQGCLRTGLAGLADGSVAVKGTFDGSAVFGPGEPSETALVGTGPRSDYVARYDAAGALVWARGLGGSGGAGGIAASADGDLVVSGDFEGEIVLGAGEPNQVELSSLGHFDVYLAALADSGALIWAERAGSSGLETTTAVSALSDGSFLVAGYFMDIVSFDRDEPSQITLESAGSDTSFVARYDAAGVVQWAIPLGGEGWVDACSLAPLAGDRFAVTGWLGDVAPATLGSGTSQETTLISTGGEDAFVAVFDGQGILSLGFGFGSAGSGSIDDRGLGVAAAGDGAVVVVGSFEGESVSFGSGDGAAVLHTAGGSDAFFALIAP